MAPIDPRRAAAMAGVSAYALWGTVPLYFKLVGGVRPDEVIAHRVLWSVAFLLAVLAIRNRGNLRRHLAISPRVAGALAVSGLLIAVNWLVFVHAVVTDRVLETSLGYFINPLVSVLLGVIVLRERLPRLQAAAVVLAASGTAYMTVMVGKLPLIALALAFSFGLYGLVRKLTDVGPMVGLFWETLMMAPLAAAWIWWLGRSDLLVFGTTGVGMDALLAGTGLVTVIPLVLFATAARGLNLITLGIMQYLAPSISFCLAVFLFRETFTLNHAIAFGAIWAALALYTAAGYYRMRQVRLAG